jgi:hypothetical protein
MEGKKLGAAQAGLKTIIKTLNRNDRITLHTFNSEVRFSENLLPGFVLP